MVENSKIEWTDHTFNPWVGCEKVSEGCANCYAEQLMDIRLGRVKWGKEGTRSRTGDDNWMLPLRWDRQAEEDGVRPRVFCSSLADVFEDKDYLIPWRHDLFELIENTPNLDWLLLTKRPENVARMMDHYTEGFPENVWMGTSVENQKWADIRIPELIKIPAAVRFLSMEPLLGPVNIFDSLKLAEGRDDVQEAIERYWDRNNPYHLHWVIVGGESGPNARPMFPEWVFDLRAQCQGAGIPFFFKQTGNVLARALNLEDKKGGRFDELPDIMALREFPVR